MASKRQEDKGEKSKYWTKRNCACQEEPNRSENTPESDSSLFFSISDPQKRKEREHTRLNCLFLKGDDREPKVEDSPQPTHPSSQAVAERGCSKSHPSFERKHNQQRHDNGQRQQHANSPRKASRSPRFLQHGELLFVPPETIEFGAARPFQRRARRRTKRTAGRRRACCWDQRRRRR
jgi:hypothetical protein